MRVITSLTFMLCSGVLSTPVSAADIVKKLTAEVDPIAPASASYEQTAHGVSTSKWGFGVDFNVGGVFSTGPEIWTGNFTAQGNSAGNQTYTRQDLYPGEQEKIDATRFRWTATKWEQESSMRGWYLKSGYSYTRVNSKANRYLETAGQGDAIPTPVPGVTPADDIALVTDIRHGLMVGFGNRWLFSDQKLSVTLGASYTSTFRRTVTVDSKDPNALANYNQFLESLPDTRISTRPTPETNMMLGYSF